MQRHNWVMPSENLTFPQFGLQSAFDTMPHSDHSVALIPDECLVLAPAHFLCKELYLRELQDIDHE